ncbi:MAG: hypothetical protein KDC49_06570 [Saprospiraceae bacterium]|nr:hypothetical protein [Saprospiraceae bacterium]
MKHKIVCFIVLLLSISIDTIAQDLAAGDKLMSNFSVGYDLNKKIRIGLQSMTIADRSLQYLSYGLSGQYQINKRNEISLAADRIQMMDGGRFSELFHSIQLGYENSINSKTYGLKNGVALESNFPSFRKYKNRVIFSSEFVLKTNFTALRIRPFTEARLYYYHGGKGINYYNPEGDLVITKSPNDFHRYRVYLGIKTRPFKQVHLNIAYFLNREFNSNLFPYSQLNVPNRRGTKTIAPFNNYNGIFTSLSFSIN